VPVPPVACVPGTEPVSVLPPPPSVVKKSEVAVSVCTTVSVWEVKLGAVVEPEPSPSSLLCTATVPYTDGNLPAGTQSLCLECISG